MSTCVSELGSHLQEGVNDELGRLNAMVAAEATVQLMIDLNLPGTGYLRRRSCQSGNVCRVSFYMTTTCQHLTNLGKTGLVLLIGSAYPRPD